MDPIIYIVAVIGIFAALLLVARRHENNSEIASTDFQKKRLFNEDNKSDLINDSSENRTFDINQETTFALRVGAIFLFIIGSTRAIGAILLLLAVTLEGGNVRELLTFERIVYPIVEFWAGYALWKGNLNWRGSVIFFEIIILSAIALRAVMALVINIPSIGLLLSFLGYLLIIFALGITLFGEASKNRTWFGISVFVLGFIVIITGGLLVEIATPSTIGLRQLVMV